MACCRTPQQIIIPLSHLPTAMLIIGTFVFWIEMYAVRLPGGHTSWLAWGLWGFLLCLALKQHKFRFKVKLTWGLWLYGVCAAIYIAIVFVAALLPPHLPQEFDVINYHITIPRQHLILQNFAHIPWSVADLFLLPLDYALSPFWLATSLPNKFPQFIFFLGVITLVFQIVYAQTNRLVKACTATVAVMALHMVAIQAGTAMLDMVMLYCVLASIHSLLKGRYALAAIEWAFFFWSKSFLPPMVIVIGIIIFVIIIVANRFHFTFEQIYEPVFRQWKSICLIFALASMIIAGPSIFKSMYYTGSPIYGIKFLTPIAKHSAEHWHWMNTRIDDHLAIIDAYGHGRSVKDFINHFWLIAVPEKGVNNAYDYPVGLIYLLVMGPFILSIWKSLKVRKIPIITLFIVVWWALWFMGSQQTRFLLIPMCLMIVVSFISIKQVSRVLAGLVLACLLLEIVSLRNAHQADWGKSGYSVLRERDKELLQMAKEGNDAMTTLEYPDVAYAAFPVNVRNNDDSIFVFPQ